MKLADFPVLHLFLCHIFVPSDLDALTTECVVHTLPLKAGIHNLWLSILTVLELVKMVTRCPITKGKDAFYRGIMDSGQADWKVAIFMAFGCSGFLFCFVLQEVKGLALEA